MASAHPARFLGLSDLGVLATGSRASLVLLNDELRPVRTWIDGRA
jgi:N-acetylglucosamine-6-phosphate deacetylase